MVVIHPIIADFCCFFIQPHRIESASFTLFRTHMFIAVTTNVVTDVVTAKLLCAITFDPARLRNIFLFVLFENVLYGPHSFHRMASIISFLCEADRVLNKGNIGHIGSRQADI